MLLNDFVSRPVNNFIHFQIFYQYGDPERIGSCSDHHPGAAEQPEQPAHEGDRPGAWPCATAGFQQWGNAAASTHTGHHYGAGVPPGGGGGGGEVPAAADQLRIQARLIFYGVFH